jgi:hypothetical protein
LIDQSRRFFVGALRLAKDKKMSTLTFIDKQGVFMDSNITQMMVGIKNSPEYDPSFPLSPGYEEKLYQHYGRSLATEREHMHRVKH